MEHSYKPSKFAYAKATLASKAENITDLKPISPEDVVRRDVRPSVAKNKIDNQPSTILRTDNSNEINPVLSDIEYNIRRLATIGSLKKNSHVPLASPTDDDKEVAKTQTSQDKIQHEDKYGTNTNSIKPLQVNAMFSSIDRIHIPKKEDKVKPEFSNLLESTPIITYVSNANGMGTRFKKPPVKIRNVVEKGSDAYDHTPMCMYSKMLKTRTRRVTTATSCNMDLDPEAPPSQVRQRKQIQTKLDHVGGKNFRVIPTSADKVEYIENKYLMQWHGVIDNRETTPRVCISTHTHIRIHTYE